MASNIVSVDLSKADNWIIEDSTNEEISPNYQEKRRPPKVGWQMNTISTSEGIKSATTHSSDYPITAAAATVNPSEQSRFNKCIDTKGLVTYAFLGNDAISSFKYSYSIFWKSIQAFEVILKDASVNTLGMHTLQTIFQNRTLHIYDSNTLIQVTENGAVTNEGFFDITVTDAEVSIFKYEVTGITIDSADFRGITSSGNYVILYNDSTIFWSDPIVFTEFTIGGSSQAGSQKISEAKGNILAIIPHPQGLIIYCSQNIISMVYSGDPTNPWIFDEIRGGAGLSFYGSTPLVTHDESAAFQYAYTSVGLLRVDSNQAIPMPTKLNKYLANAFVEDLPFGGGQTSDSPSANRSREIITTYYSDETSPANKVRCIEAIGNYLFLTVGPPIPDGVTLSTEFLQNRFIVLDLQTGARSILKYSVAAVTGLLQEPIIHAESRDYIDSRQVDDSFICMYRRNRQTGATFVLDMTSKSNNFRREDHLEDLQGTTTGQPVVYVGEISINPDRLTELIRVKLTGETTYIDPDTGIVDEATRVKVYAYSSINGDTNPVPFIYYPALDAYLGFITGEDISVEIRGDNFYLTDAEFEIQDGGRV